MTTQPEQAPDVPDGAAEALPRSWRRLLALSGVAFAALFVVGWFTTGGVTPHYNAPDQDWTNWASDNQWNGRISGFLMLLAGFVFLYFMAAVRSVFGSAEAVGLGSAGLLTLRTRVFASWMGIVALIGGMSFLVTFLTVLDGTTDGSPFGYGFFPGVVALVIWTLSTSVITYRALATTAP
jgi:hypothetical protein